MKILDVEEALYAVEAVRLKCCAYMGGERCDCKYGIVTGKPAYGERGNGCPELYGVADLLRALTPFERARLVARVEKSRGVRP